MVALGNDMYGRTNKIEVVDLKNPRMICQDLPEYPFALKGAAAFLNFEEEPEICGGYDEIDAYKVRSKLKAVFKLHLPYVCLKFVR